MSTVEGSVPSWARKVTDGVQPANVILAVLLLIGGVRYGLPGLGWALFATLFAAVLPLLFIKFGARTDRHVGQRRRRLVVIPVIMASVLAGLGLMTGLGAPREMTAMVVAMFATLVPIMAITVWWKVSVHTAVSGGAVAMLVTSLGPWWLLGYALVAVVGWSRVELRDHTRAQTAVGAVVGTVTAGLVFWALR